MPEDERLPAPTNAPDQWSNLRNVILAKIGNLQREVRVLREQLIGKESEITGLREAQDQIERFAPKT